MRKRPTKDDLKVIIEHLQELCDFPEYDSRLGAAALWALTLNTLGFTAEEGSAMLNTVKMTTITDTVAQSLLKGDTP